MSYDYSSESQRLELPNPHKVENIFLFIAGVLYFACGVTALLIAKGKLDQGNGGAFVVPFIAAVFLLGFGIRFAARAMTQLRFFFGRGLPEGLAPELTQGVVGKSAAIDSIKEDIRRGTLNFPEPQGALNGLLYHRIPHLIVAPQPVQARAQIQFRNGLVIALTMVSLLVAWLGFGGANSAPWIGVFYFAFASWLVMKPLAGNSAGEVKVNELGIIILIITAVIGPVLIAFAANRLPNLVGFNLHWQALFLLVSALAAVGLYFMALLRQLSPPPSTNMSCEQISLNINTHPAQIIGEFDRVMQQKWVEKIPNRRYSRLDPTVNAEAKAGSFSGEVVEETQPMPSKLLESLSLGTALGNERTRWLVYLNLLGLILLAAGAAAVVIFASKFVPQAMDYTQFAYLTFAFVAFSVGRYCFNAASSLWARFDFVSEVIWIELAGQYTTAKNRLGNDFSSQVRTESNSINIDSMTMRVWTARIESVVFGKDSRRMIVAMSGQSDVTKGLAAHLTDFAQSRSMFVAPSNQEDLKKIAATQAAQAMQGAGGHAASAAATAGLQALAGGASAVSGAASTGVASTTAANKFCTECGAGNLIAAKFCSGCGHKFSD